MMHVKHLTQCPTHSRLSMHFYFFFFPHSTPQPKLKFQIGLFVKEGVYSRVTRSPCDVKNETDQSYNKGTVLQPPALSHRYFIKANSSYLKQSKYCHSTKQKQNPRHSNRSPKGNSQVYKQTSKLIRTERQEGRGYTKCTQFLLVTMCMCVCMQGKRKASLIIDINYLSLYTEIFL